MKKPQIKEECFFNLKHKKLKCKYNCETLMECLDNNYCKKYEEKEVKK